MSAIDISAEVLAAEQRIRAHIRQTPLERSNYLSDLVDADVYLKLESAQITGSFKLRGAMNKMFSLSEQEREEGLLTASSGNHGTACAELLFDVAPGVTLHPVQIGTLAELALAVELGDHVEPQHVGLALFELVIELIEFLAQPPACIPRSALAAGARAAKRLTDRRVRRERRERVESLTRVESKPQLSLDSVSA